MSTGYFVLLCFEKSNLFNYNKANFQFVPNDIIIPREIFNLQYVLFMIFTGLGKVFWGEGEK